MYLIAFWLKENSQIKKLESFDSNMIPNNDNNETKVTVGLAKGELKLVQVTAAGATVETVYRRAK